MFPAASAAPPAITYLYPAGAQRGTTVEVAAAGSFDKWPVTVWAGGTGVTVRPGKDKGKLSVTVAADAVPGVYWLRAANEDGAGGVRPFIVGLLPEVAEKEPNDEPKAAQPVDRPTTVNGRLDKAGDVDCFAVPVKKGQTLVASLEANHTLKSPMDAILQVVSADGFVLDQNHDLHGLDPQLAYTAPVDGPLVVRVFAFPSNPDSSIRFSGGDASVYRLTLTTGGFADYPVPLAVSRVKPEPVSVVGWNVPEAAKALPVPDSRDEFATVFHPEITNPFRVRLEPHATFDRTQPAHVGPLVPPVSVTGRLDTPTQSVALQGKKGQPLTLQVQSRSLGLAANPVVRVADVENNQLARAEPTAVGGDTTLSFTPPADGTYVVTVSDLYGGSGPRHAFLLRVLTPEPDYELTVAADRFAVPPGKPLDVPVKLARRNGFAKPVEVVAEGLPAGVTCVVKPPEGKPDPNTVVVSLAGEKAGVGGTFRLVGRVKDEPAFTRTARAPLAEFDTTTVDLWVTVTGSLPPAKK
ncbi:MAG: hypothetical protein K2P78_10545 [Gemmataceae bacterium]|nr:hypothetical protein [Gemmataceae bacterium]